MTSEIGQVCNVKIGGMYVREIIILSMVKISQFNCGLKLHLFISVCLDNKKHNYIKTFDEWGDVFDIYFEIRVDILPDCGPNCVWTNVLHFNAGGDDNANYGDRIPAVMDLIIHTFKLPMLSMAIRIMLLIFHFMLESCTK